MASADRRAPPLARAPREDVRPRLAASELARQGLAKECPFLAFCELFSRVNALLYMGRATEAVAELDEARPAIRAAHLLRSQFNRVEFAYLCGRAALARASECHVAEHASLIKRVRSSIRSLRRKRVPWATALASALGGSLAMLVHGRDAAVAQLRASADQLAAVGLGMSPSAVRWQLRHVLDSEDGGGALWCDAAVVRPDRLAQTFVPLPDRSRA